MSEVFHINQYTIQERIGDGGMAEVFLAFDNQMKNNVAIKKLKPEMMNFPNIKGRFMAEARSMFSMNHPNVAKVYGIIEEEGFVGAVMEYVPGITLSEYIENKGKPTNDVIESLLLQMIESLRYVHNVGVIHRDIKPSNFMVDDANNVKLLDFGIAKNNQDQFSDYTMTGTSQQMGTPLYMSPEQIKHPDRITHATDIYSLGVVLYFMAVGKSPYDKNLSLFDLQSKIVHEKLPLTNTIWDRIITKATEKDPLNRFKNAEELYNAVKNLKMNDTVLETVHKTHSKVGRVFSNKQDKKSKRKMLFYIAIPLIILLTVVIVVSQLETDEEKIEAANSVVTMFAKDLELDSRNEKIYPGIDKMGSLYYLREFNISDTEINPDGTITVFCTYKRQGSEENVKFTVEKQNGEYKIKASRGVSGYYDSPLMTYCLNKGYLSNFNDITDKELTKVCQEHEFSFNSAVNRLIQEIPNNVIMNKNASNITTHYGIYADGYVTIVNNNKVDLPMGSVKYVLSIVDNNYNQIYTKNLTITANLGPGQQIVEDVYLSDVPRRNFKYLVYAEVINRFYFELAVAKNPSYFE